MTEALTLVPPLLQGIERARRQRRWGSNVVYRRTLFASRGFTVGLRLTRVCDVLFSRQVSGFGALLWGADW